VSIPDRGEQMPTKESTKVLGIVQRHLDSAKEGCVVGKWVETLADEEQKAFAIVKERNSLVSLNAMFQDLFESQDLPFGLTSFRTHFRGKCTCQKIS
jgi:hypothetical protein